MQPAWCTVKHQVLDITNKILTHNSSHGNLESALYRIYLHTLCHYTPYTVSFVSDQFLMRPPMKSNSLLEATWGPGPPQGGNNRVPKVLSFLRLSKLNLHTLSKITIYKNKFVYKTT